jgi:hypothetical protein
MSNARNLANLLGTGTQITTADIADGAFRANKNLIINGAMQVAQRGTSVSGITSNNYNTADRFLSYFSGGGYDEAVVSDAPDGFSKSLKITTSTADATLDAGDRLNIAHKIEGQNVQHLNFGSSAAKQFTVSFWVKSSVTGVYALEIYHYANGSHFTKNYTISSANTWEYKTITYTADTSTAVSDSNSAGIATWFWLRAGSTYNSGAASNTWNTSNNQRAIGQTADVGAVLNSTFQITGIQLEVGDTATPFEHRSYGEELAICQRYYVNTINVAFYNNSITSHIVRVALPVEMRANPTVTRLGSFWSGSENAPNIYPQYGNKKAFYISGGTTTFLGGVFTSDAEL